MTAGNPASRLILKPGHWYSWQVIETGDRSEAPFDASPVFIAKLTAEKTGAGTVLVSWVCTLQPLRARLERLRLKVLHRDADTIIGLEIGAGRIHAIGRVGLTWLQRRCPRFWQRHENTINYMWSGAGDPQEILSYLLGDTVEKVAAGASTASCDDELPPMSERSGTIRFERDFSGMDAWLVLRGRIPNSSDDKWFIYAELCGNRGTLFVRRSWTGLLVWTVAFDVVGDGIATTAAEVCLDVSARQFGTPDQEAAVLDHCIALELLGQGSGWPLIEAPDAAVFRAWGMDPLSRS